MCASFSAIIYILALIIIFSYIVKLTPAEWVECGDNNTAEEHQYPGQQQDVSQEDEAGGRHASSNSSNVASVDLDTCGARGQETWDENHESNGCHTCTQNHECKLGRFHPLKPVWNVEYILHQSERQINTSEKKINIIEELQKQLIWFLIKKPISPVHCTTENSHTSPAHNQCNECGIRGSCETPCASSWGFTSSCSSHLFYFLYILFFTLLDICTFLLVSHYQISWIIWYEMGIL